MLREDHAVQSWPVHIAHAVIHSKSAQVTEISYHEYDSELKGVERVQFI